MDSLSFDFILRGSDGGELALNHLVQGLSNLMAVRYLSRDMLSQQTLFAPTHLSPYRHPIRLFAIQEFQRFLYFVITRIQL